MDNREFESAVEALLFSMGDAVPVTDIASVMEMDEIEVIKRIDVMAKRWEAKERGLRIIAVEDAYQMCTAPSMYDYLIKLTHRPKKHKLTDAALETLSIVAYRQPVTRAEIEKIRGVNCDAAINRLIMYDLIAEAGRLDAPGKPILFATTPEFLRAFGVSSASELPGPDPEKIEEFKMEAEEEVDLGISEDS